MLFDSNFFIIIFILILVLVFLNSSTNEQFANTCSNIEPIPLDSPQNNSTYCPTGCKVSLTQDRKNIYCVDNK